MGQYNKAYKEILEDMMRELDGGKQPDQVAIDGLRAARKALVHCEGQVARAEKRKRPNQAEDKLVRVRAASAIWSNVLRKYTLPHMEKIDAFQKAFTMDGQKGYKKFMKEITDVAFESVDKNENLTTEEKVKYKAEFAKPEGWLYNIAINMEDLIWQFLVDTLKGDDKIFGHVGFYTHKKKLLKGWSKALGVANTEANVRYGNKVVHFGDVGIVGTSKGTRPSRVLPNVRSLHFLKPEQIKILEEIGKGVQGSVVTCHVLECPLIQEETIVVAKRFEGKNKEKKRRDALQEMLMGGLNHKGIVGALAITIEDPPRLVYDYYNGGNLASFFEKCEEHSKSRGKSIQDIDFKFISEKKIFLENRLGIALALLETMAALHSVDRVHADLHHANFLLHFDYVHEEATKVYVGMCDFGLSMHISQCDLRKKRMFTTPEAEIVEVRERFPQLAPELVGPNPANHSKASDIYALGNLFETLLQAPDKWDGMDKYSRILDIRWDAKYYAGRLDGIIRGMMSTDVKKRMDCNHWSSLMVRAFPNCQLHPQNSLHLRD